ncbi:MAG TPA: hypothetical protein VI588_01510 [Candidatus Gracilibacteria bacterium]|nr:hypothetical protein [Candidatus Gracilibacteria bacterium]
MKKAIFVFALLTLFSLITVRGFQLLQATGFHIMDGEMSMTHEMPVTECTDKACYMSLNTKLLLAVFFAGTELREFTVMLLAIVLGFALYVFLADKYRLYKSREPTMYLCSVPVAVNAVIFRE